MNCTKGAHESQKETQEPCRRPGRIGPQMVCQCFTLTLRISDQQPGEFTSSKLRDLDMQIQGSHNSPMSGEVNVKRHA